jgi:hypothetical protein
MINKRWKTRIPGFSLSSPAILGDKVFITTDISKSDKEGIKTGIYADGIPVADSSVQQWIVICIKISIKGKQSGKEQHIPGFQRSGDILSLLMPIHPLP